MVKSLNDYRRAVGRLAFAVHNGVHSTPYMHHSVVRSWEWHGALALGAGGVLWCTLGPVFLLSCVGHCHEVGWCCGRAAAVAQPTRLVVTLFDPAMEAGPRPRMRATGYAVLDRVVVDVVHVADHVFFVANPVLPEAPLSNAALAVATPRLRDACLDSPGGEPQAGEVFLDAGPTGGVIAIAWWQSPDAMEMFRQQDDSGHVEGPAGLDPPNDGAEVLASLLLREERSPVVRDDPEEERPSRLKKTSIIRHGSSLRAHSHRIAQLPHAHSHHYPLFLVFFASWRDNRFGCGRRPRWVLCALRGQAIWIPAGARKTGRRCARHTLRGYPGVARASCLCSLRPQDRGRKGGTLSPRDVAELYRIRVVGLLRAGG